MHRIVEEDFENIVSTMGQELMRLEGKTLLVSGGSGFLGTYIVGVIKFLNKKKLKNPCKVISVDNFITGSKDNIVEDIEDVHAEYRTIDVTKPFTIKENIHFIIHAAGIASPVYYQNFPLETIDVAVQGTRNMLEYAQANSACESFLFTSSSEIYGDPSKEFIPTPETYKGNVSSIGPRSCYDESKRLAETICMTYFRKYQTPIKIVRPFNVYGPGMKLNDYRVVPNFITQGLKGEILTVHDRGTQTRTFCYISDAIIAIFKVLLSNKNGEVFNIGNDKNEIAMVDLAKMIIPLFPKQVTMELIHYPSTYPADEPTRRCPDISKIKNILKFDPKIQLEEGLMRTVAWFKDNIHDGK